MCFGPVISTLDLMADSFVIGETEFGIDPASVKVEFPLRPDGLANVHIEVGASETVFERLCEDEEWSWALYPPFFFIRLYPVSPQDAALSCPIAIPARDESFEMNLYMMEYCAVDSVVLRKEAGGIEISGRVDLWGRDMPFRIQLGERA